MENKAKVVENDKKLFDNENLNRNLLKDLIYYVEEFLSKKDEVTKHLADIIKRIFYSNLKVLDKNGQPNIRRVFGILDFLNQKSVDEQRLHFNKWLLENIHKGKLSNFLSFILSDTEHIKNCYESSAFIRSEAYQNALMLCILALESNQRSHLSKIDKTLYEKNKAGHRRSISQPFIPTPQQIPRKSILSHLKRTSRTFDSYSNSSVEKVKVLNHRRCKSLPNLSHESYSNRPRSKTITINKNNNTFNKRVSFKSEVGTDQVPFFEYRDTASTNMNNLSNSKQSIVPIHLVKVDDIKIHTDYRFTSDSRSSNQLISPASSNSSSKLSLTPKRSFFSFFESPLIASKIHSPDLLEASCSTSPSELFLTETVVAGEKIRSKSTIVTPNLLKNGKDGTKKRKSSRQNLLQLIHTINSSRQKVELERENLHFYYSEAIISTCEQIKWNKMFDEKYKIPKDCRIKQSLSHNNSQKNLQPPPKIQAKKFIIGSVEDDTESSVSSDEPQVEIRKSSSSSDDISENTPQMEWTSSLDSHCAESIALSLMSKFKNVKIPTVNNFSWLVNESQAPQQLLPVPDSYPINPDECFTFNTIRGSSYWAPPRQQIIFTIHPPPDRKRCMLQQANRCAGCGIKIAPAYIHKLRYCDYIGKYFCSSCHKMQVSVIPARVLDKWDFTPFAVSNFAYKWLDQIWNLPLFHVSDLNPKLYQKVKPLTAAREARLQLKYVSDFIKECRFTEREKELIAAVSDHWIDDVDIWSMVDFMNVKNSTFSNSIQDIIKQCEDHIIKNNCELCTARGFICELCPNKRDVIFPWMNKVKRCIACGSCYHEKCFKTQCSKCERLKRRKRLVKQMSGNFNKTNISS
ncbi:hypothetical protein ACKWTF_001017 [Chironomus riparius]